MEASRKGKKSSAPWIKAIAAAQLVFLAAGVLLLLLFCRIAYSLDDPAAVTAPLSMTALCLSSLAGGIAAVRLTGDGLLSGLISGTVSLALVRALSALPLPASGMDMGQTVLFCCLIPALSVCGAVLGKKRKKSTRHKHR